MDPSNTNFTNYTNLLSQDSYNQHPPPNQNPENTNLQCGQNSPPSPFPTGFSQSQYPQSFTPPNYMQNFHPFGVPGNYPSYPHPPLSFQGVHPQRNWMQPTPASFQGVQVAENYLHSPNQVFGFAAKRSPSLLQSSPSVGGGANSSSHGSDSSTPYSHQRCEEIVCVQQLKSMSLAGKGIDEKERLGAQGGGDEEDRAGGSSQLRLLPLPSCTRAPTSTCAPAPQQAVAGEARAAVAVISVFSSDLVVVDADLAKSCGGSRQPRRISW